MRIGTWNVRSLDKTGATEQLIKELKSYNLHITALQLVRWPGEGCMVVDELSKYYSGSREGLHRHGVGIAVDAETKKAITEVKCINDRLMSVRFNGRKFKLSMTCAYAPTNEAEEMDKERFYDALEELVRETPKNDVLVVMGDFNAKVGREAQVGYIFQIF